MSEGSERSNREELTAKSFMESGISKIWDLVTASGYYKVIPKDVILTMTTALQYVQDNPPPPEEVEQVLHPGRVAEGYVARKMVEALAMTADAPTIQKAYKYYGPVLSNFLLPDIWRQALQRAHARGGKGHE